MDIVTVNVSRTVAAAPVNLQKKGALISHGGTVTLPGTLSLLTEFDDLTPLLVEPESIASAVLSTAQIATITTTQIHGLTLNDVVPVVIAGIVSPTTANLFNGSHSVTVTGTSTFTFPLTGTAQTATSSTGTWTPVSLAELISMATTFFAQGSSQSVYVLEVGDTNAASQVAFLSSWISENKNTIYSYLVPKSWDAIPSFLALANQYNATTSKTYFFATTTLATYTSYTLLQKSIFAMVEAPATGVWAANALSALSFSGAWDEDDLTGISWSAANGGTVTATTMNPHGVKPGNTFVISGQTPAGYNGSWAALPGTTGSTLKFALAVDPGVSSDLGQLDASVAGTATATTTTAHGVLPGQTFTISGSLSGTIQAGYNGTFTALPGTTGSSLLYSIPADPGSVSIDGTLLASHYASPGVAALEFSAAAPFYVTLNYKPSTTNKVTPTAFSFLFDVTPFPLPGWGTTLNNLEAAGINVVGTGAEGGISTAVLFWGTTKDKRDFTYWYSVDWAQINVQIDVSNAVINGSNNPKNPLYYEQNGINRLQGVAAGTFSRGLTYGLVNGAVTQTQLDGTDFVKQQSDGKFAGQTVVNAVPFVPYSQENPDDYAIGEYDGMAAAYLPSRGFKHILFNITITDFVAS